MSRKGKSQEMSAGVGYVSVMLIFAVICLTIFAVLSLKAALSDESINERSEDFLKNYYAADTAAKEKLSLINDIAHELKDSEFFEEAFAEKTASLEGVTAQTRPDGISVSYSVEINERQRLFVNVVFNGKGEYTVKKWQSRSSASGDDDNSHINVWDGTFE